MTFSRFFAVTAYACSLLASTVGHGQVLFSTINDNGFFTPFNSQNAATVKYGDSGWLGQGPGSPPVALGRITLYLATFGGNGIDAGTTDIEFTLNNGDPSGLVFGSGSVLYSTTIVGVELPPSTQLEATFFPLTIDLPAGVSTTGGFNNVGWSVKCRNYNYVGQFGFQAGTCAAQLVGFYTNNASFFNGLSWSLFAFGADTCTQIAQFSVLIEAPIAAPCPGDLDTNGQIDGADLTLLLSGWGTSAGDVNGDGVTDGSDLTVALGGWGACP